MTRRPMSPEIRAARRRVAKARRFPENTCPASRHVCGMADTLVETERFGGWDVSAPDAEHLALSLYATVSELWELRSRTAERSEG